MNEAALPSLQAAIRSRGLTNVGLAPIQSFISNSPELRASLSETESWLEPSLDVLLAGLPIPPTVASFVQTPFYRPPASHRCFYYSPEGMRGVLAFKGLEPSAADIDELVRYLERPCFSPHDIAEHLAIEEHKIPACLSLEEAMAEAERANLIQCAHVRAYGTLARLPLPLFVFRHADETASQMVDRLRSRLSVAAFEIVEPLLGAGLGVYVYYYPTPPVRAKDIDFLLRSMGFSDRTSVVQSICDPDVVIARWVSVIVRMFYLGILPCSLATLHTGACCQPQNACIDGGFVDLDSLTPIADLTTDTAVFAALQFTTECLLRTLRSLVAGSSDPVRKEANEIRVDLHYLTQHLFARFARAFEAEKRPGLELDPRIVRYFTAPESFAELRERLASYHIEPNRAFDEKSAGFGALGQLLVARARDY